MKVVFPDYNNSTLSMINSILKHYNVQTNHSSLKILDEKLNNYKKIVLIILDGLGNNLLEKISKNGFFNKNKLTKISTVFPSTTVAAINTISSGLSPVEHGWLGWTLYFKEVDRTIKVFRNEYVAHDDPVTLDYYSIIKYKNIFSYLKEKNISCQYYRPDNIPNNMEDAENYKYKTFKEGIKMLVKNSNNNEKSFTYFYCDDPDKTLHIKGTKSFIVKHMIKKMEKIIKKNYKKIDDTLFIISADHGLVDIDGSIYLRNDKDIYKMLKRRISIESRASSIFLKDKYKSIFKEIFIKKYGDKFDVYSKEEVLNNNIFGFGKPHERVDCFLGDYLVVAKGKWTLNYSNEHKSFMKASHAGMTEDEMIIPLIVFDNKK